MSKYIHDIIIIGGGASGLFAAAVCPSKVKGLILDKAGRPGLKLLMSGAGQCNLTHGGDIKDFITRYGQNGGRIRTSLFKYSNQDVVRFFNAEGVPVFEREDGKVFPKSLKAEDVLNCLLKKAGENGFEVKSGCSVTEISKSEDETFEIKTEKQTYYSRRVICCTGGCSYPSTGSDGSMFSALEKLGLTVVEPRPGLVPVSVEGYPYGDLSGASVSNVKVQTAGQVVYGDVLFTHRNLSGPGILHISRYVKPGSEISLCYCAEMTKDQAAELIKKSRNDKTSSRKEALTVVKGIFPSLPSAFVHKIWADEGLDGHLKLAEWPARAAASVLDRIFNDTWIVSGTSGYKAAMVTAGGVSLKEISTKTFESKKIPGFYMAGEMLDVDGDTGGYNLQFAFSSAYAAVNAAVSSL